MHSESWSKVVASAPVGMLKFLTISVACAWVGVSLLIYFYQARLIFHPTRELTTTPADQGLAYVDAAIGSTDGETLHGWFVPHPRAAGTVLFLHGNAGNISDRPLTLERLHAMGLNVLMLDYRGYGRSTGQPSAKGTIVDARAAWHYLIQEQNQRAKDIIIYGRSLGGAVAIELASQTSPRAVIVESTFTSLSDMAADIYPYLPTRLLLRHRYPSVTTIAKLEAPLLIVHSDDDELIPPQHGQRLFDAATPPKQFYRLTGSHNRAFIEAGDTYYETMQRFIVATQTSATIDAD